MDASMTNTGLSLLIREERTKLKLTQQQLADLAMTTQKTISRLETGRENGTMFTILAILEALDLTLTVSSSEKEVPLTQKRQA